MRVRTATILTICFIAATVLVVTPAFGLGVGVVAVADNATEETSADENESDTFGQQVSSFAQASAADADTSVDKGMWNGSVTASENPQLEVDNRVGALVDRLERLENRSAELDAMLENDSIHEHVYDARASAIRTQIANVESTLNHTAETAQRHGVGVNETKLETLRTEASNMTGPEVSALARNITDAPRGPPADRGPPENAGQPNENETGPPGDVGQSDQGGPVNESPGGNHSADTQDNNATDVESVAGGLPEDTPASDRNPGPNSDAGETEATDE